MQKIKENVIKIGLWFNDKKIAAGLVIAFIMTMLPMLIVAKYSHASADDFGWGAGLRKRVWEETHSLWQLIVTSLETTKGMYHGWQGTFTTTFVQAFQPEIFDVNAYFIVPYIIMPFFFGGTALLLHFLLVRMLRLKKSVFVIVTMLYFLISVQYIPSTGEAFYWFNGAVAYTLAYAGVLFCVYFSLKYIWLKKNRYLLMAVFTAFFVGGGNYLTIVLLPLLLVLLLFLFTPKRKHTLYLLIPFLVFAVTAVINMTAPGTRVRGGSDFGFDLQKVFSTIFRAIYEGLKDVRSEYLNNPVIMICMVFIAIFLVVGMLEQKYEFSFKNPVLFVMMTLGSYLAMYAPTYYANVGTPFGRMSNLISFYFELSLIADIVYVTGYFMRVMEKHCKSEEKGIKKMLGLAVEKWNISKIYIICCAVVLILVNTDWYSTTAVVRTVKYLASGEAEQFGKEMDERYKILLDESIKDVELEPLSVSAGPLFLYDIQEDPDIWPNTAVADFFNKNSVKFKEE